MSTAIIALGILYFIGHVLTHIFNKAKIPDVLILIIFGIIIGPILHIVDPQQIGILGSLFTSIALIIILFEGGLGIEIGNIMRSADQSIKLTVAFFFITAFLIFALMHFGFGFSPLASIVTGFICGGTSSSVVIPMISAMRGVGREASTVLILESALTDVLCIVFTIGMLHSIESGEFEVGKIIGSLISSLILASIIGALGGLFWLNMVSRVRQFQSTQFATFAFMFIVYGIAEALDFSGAIASLAFGVVLGNNRTVNYLMKNTPFKFISVGVVTDAEKKLYKEIVFLIKIFFFIFIGISIPVEHMHVVLIALSIVVAVFVARPIVTKILVIKHVTAYDRTIISVMVPKGLAAAVLAGLPNEYGMAEGNDIQAITYNVVLLSIVATSILIPIIERTPIGNLMKRFFTIAPRQQPTQPSEIQEKA